jgi:integrase
MQVLTQAEIARLLAAYRELEQGAEREEREWWALSRRLVEVALGTALRRGELLALRWSDVELLEGRLHVREALVRGRFGAPTSRSSRRMLELGPVPPPRCRSSGRQAATGPTTASCSATRRSARRSTRASCRGAYMRPALARARIEKPFRPWHDLRHTALTHEAAAGNPQAYVQLKAGHSQGSITERYIHAAQVLLPGAAAARGSVCSAPRPPQESASA